MNPEIDKDRARVFAQSLFDIALDEVEVRLSQFDAELDDAEKHQKEKLNKLVQVKGQRLLEVSSAKAEHPLGRAGRADVVISGRTAEAGIVFVLENKIDSEEYEQQLKNYVRAITKSNEPSSMVVPVLIALGDKPPKKASCEWAVVIDRDKAIRWLEAGRQECNGKNIVVPPVVHDYRDVLEAFRCSAAFRENNRELIDRVQQQKVQDAEWSLLKHWVYSTDESFFQEVLKHGVLKDCLSRRELKKEASGAILGRNELLQIWKDEWKHGVLDHPKKGVGVHFEARHRGSFQLDVELEPYEGSVGKDPLRLDQLRPVLAVKAELIRKFRGALCGSPNLGKEILADEKGLRQWDAPSTCCAVRFRRRPQEPITVESCARFYAEVIERVTETVDSEIRALKTTGTHLEP